MIHKTGMYNRPSGGLFMKIGFRRRFTVLLLVSSFLLCCCSCELAEKSPRRTLIAENLRCEYQVNPLGIDENKPRLSWTLKSNIRGQRQTAYQVIASTSLENVEANRGDQWDSQKVVSSDSIQIIYQGVPLTSVTRYYWKIRVWDDQGNISNWVQGSYFRTKKHRYPTINFSWSPENPSEDEDVQFTDQSTVYGGASKSAWSWIFTNADPVDSDDQNPIVKFTTQGNNAVALNVTDSDGYTCPNPKTVGVQESLPWWEEVLPW